MGRLDAQHYGRATFRQKDEKGRKKHGKGQMAEELYSQVDQAHPDEEKSVLSRAR